MLMNHTFWLSLVFAAQAFTAATAGTVSQSPLFLTSSAKPNIMLLIDNSGSMSNIVPESPYDATVSYACPPALRLPTTQKIDIRIDTNGIPFFNNGADIYWVNTGASGRCFDPDATYWARLYATDGSSPGDYLPAEYSGHYLNWYFGSDVDGANYGATGMSPDWGAGTIRIKPGTLRRMDIARVAAASLVDSLDNARIGLATYDAGGAGADIKISVSNADTEVAKTALKTVIGALTPTGSTPLAEALHEIGRYFVGTTGGVNPGHQSSPSCTVNGQYDGSIVLHPGTTHNLIDEGTLFNRSPGAYQSPICHSCQKNFVILLTDGRSQDDQDLTVGTGLRDYDGDCSGCVDDRKSARTYESNGSDYLDDVAQALYEIDLRPDIDDVDGNEVINNLSTYTIGFADDQVIKDPLMQEAAYQGGGLFLQASNASELLTSLKTTISDIQAKLGSASAVTTSSTRFRTSTIAFQALFNSVDWSGQVNAMPINASGFLGPVVWNAAANMPVSSVTRNVLAWDPVAAAGISFNTGNAALINAVVASTASPSPLTSDQIDYLRGDVTNALPGGTLRSRTATAGHVPLGDIINSDPLFVKNQNFSYGRLTGDEGAEYGVFRQSSAYLNRPGMLYVGGNDGMLHGFSFSYDASSGTATGTEQFSYIPNAVFGALGALTDPSYTHRYYVDGSPVFGDAYLDTDSSGSDDSWRTVLVGTTGAGGKGVFALDITDPSGISATDVLWDLDSTQSGFSDLGVQLGEVSIARMPDGHFYAVFGNGYGSALGKAMLYLVRLDDRTQVYSIELDASGGNGLSSPLVADHDRDLTADIIYAGDLKGNLWKVNLGVSSGALTLNSAFGSDSLFVVEDAASPAVMQPITAQPEAGVHPDGGLMIYFGTGQYFEVGDAGVASPQIQTFYGIRDDFRDVSGSRVDRGRLVAQTIDAEDSTTFSGFKVRLTSNHAVHYPSKKGWYMDLGLYDSATGTTAAVGERVVNQAILRDDRLIFTTLIPSADPCSFGGNSWLMEINAVTGERLGETPFDLNDDGLFTDADKVPDPLSGGTPLISVSGLQKADLGIFDTPAILENSTQEVKVLGGSSGNIESVKESKSSSGGRQSWLQLQ